MAQSFILYHESEHLKICLNIVTDMNQTPNTVPDDNSDADINLGYEKYFHNGLSHYDNESLYIPIVCTLYEESAISMIADEDVVNHIPKNPQPWGRSHVCAHGTAART